LWHADSNHGQNDSSGREAAWASRPEKIYFNITSFCVRRSFPTWSTQK
jgi:hypothetical protein